MGKTRTIWQFVGALFPLHLEDTVSKCFVYQDSGHTQTPRICHIFVLSLLVSTNTPPEMPTFHGKALNCQIVPVLPSYLHINVHFPDFPEALDILAHLDVFETLAIPSVT